MGEAKLGVYVYRELERIQCSDRGMLTPVSAGNLPWAILEED
jgi:hypothetical protein